MTDLTKMIETVLSREETAKINFSLEGFWVHKFHFLGVRYAVKNETITVKYDATYSPADAFYHYRGDRFYFGFMETGGNVGREETVVHEAVHAAMDISAQPQYLRVSEGCAYVAGALYVYYRNKHLIDQGKQPSYSGIAAEAWALAGLARSKPALTRDDAKALYAAIDADEHYKGRLRHSERFDGVRRPAD